MKKILAALLLVLVAFSATACSTSSIKDISKLENSGKFIYSGLDYNMDFTAVSDAIKISKEANELDNEHTTTFDGKDYKLNKYVREDFTFLGEKSRLTLDFIDEKLYGIQFSYYDGDLPKFYEEIKTILTEKFGEGTEREYNPELKEKYGLTGTTFYWDQSDTRLLLSLDISNDVVTGVSVGTVDLTKVIDKSYLSK